MSPIRLLIAEAQPAIRDELAATLRPEEDFEIVAQAADGQEALAAVSETGPDLVLMNVHMPKLGGIEVTRVIKARWPAIKVVLQTASAAPSLARLAIQAGASGYLPENVSKKFLLNSLRTVGQGAFVIEEGLWHRLPAMLPGWS